MSLVGTFVVFPLSVSPSTLFHCLGWCSRSALVVDDAIVVVEAVEHHIEHGMSPKDAAFKAMEEVSGPVIAIALILAAVFIPTAFIPGITGRLYQQFAITIAISVIFSAFNALSLSPALSAALLLRPKKEARGTAGQIFSLVQPRVWAGHRRLRQPVRIADSQSWRSACFCSLAVAVAGRVVRVPPAAELPAR